MLLIGLSSCFKDKGGYDYVDINEITISEMGGPYDLLFKVDTLKISPKLNFTMDTNDPDRYRYEWRIGVAATNESQKRPLVSNERNLVFPVDLLPNSYTVYYNIYDKITEVTWTSIASLRVTTAIATGFYITGEEDGFSEVDMVAMQPNDTLIIKNLLKGNGMPRYRNPIRTIHTGSTGNQNNVKLWFLGGEGSYYVNTKTFEAKQSNTFKNMVFTTFNLPLDIYPVDIAPKSFSAAGSTTGTYSRVMITNNGYLFAASLMNGDLYGNPVNRVSSKPLEPFKLFPYIMYTPVRWDKYMVFDTENRRFMYGSGGSVPANMLTPLTDAGGPFPWNQMGTGRTLHYAENTRNYDDGSTMGNSFAIMKDSANQSHIYKFYVAGAFSPVKRGYYKILPIAENFNQANIYAFSSTRKLLYYAVGSKLYAYDYNPGLEKNYLVQDFGEEITMLNADIQQSNGSQLYVATYSKENKGTIRKFNVGPDLNNVTLTADESVLWKGLIKVKAMDWRNSTM